MATAARARTRARRARTASSSGPANEKRPDVQLTRLDILPALKDGDSLCRMAMPRHENVPCRVDVPVMPGAAGVARPLPYSEACPTLRTAGGNPPAARTGPGSNRVPETTAQRTPACSLLYRSIPRSMVQPLSYTDLASRVFPTAEGETSPTTISPQRFTRGAGPLVQLVPGAGCAPWRADCAHASAGARAQRTPQPPEPSGTTGRARDGRPTRSPQCPSGRGRRLRRECAQRARSEHSPAPARRTSARGRPRRTPRRGTRTRQAHRSPRP